MDDIDVIIIGGGVGGLSCAMTIASAGPRPWFGNRRVLVIDDGGSDLNKARLFNAPGIVPGTTGVKTLENLRAQLGQYPVATLVAGRVVRVERDGDRWVVATNSGDSYTCETIVLATGYKCCDIEALPVSPVPHPRGGKADRIMFEHDDVYRVAPNLHVAGLLGGGSSQFAIAAGIGVQVAVELLSGWAGKRTHVHDVPEPSQ